MMRRKGKISKSSKNQAKSLKMDLIKYDLIIIKAANKI